MGSFMALEHRGGGEIQPFQPPHYSLLHLEIAREHSHGDSDCLHTPAGGTDGEIWMCIRRRNREKETVALKHDAVYVSNRKWVRRRRYLVKFGRAGAQSHVWSSTDTSDDSGNEALAESDNYFN
ncbi:uncharacterized [Tachysurus ichikawai]